MKLIIYCAIFVVLCEIQFEVVQSAGDLKDKQQEVKHNDHLDPINDSEGDYNYDDWESESDSDADDSERNKIPDNAYDDSKEPSADSDESSWLPADDENVETISEDNEASHETVEKEKPVEHSANAVTWSYAKHLHDQVKERTVRRWIYITAVLGCILLAVLLLVSILRLRKIARMRSVPYYTLHEEA